MRQDVVEIPAVRAAQDAVGQREIQDDEAAAGLEDAVHFAQRGGVVGHVAQTEGDGDDVEFGVFERELQRVCDDGFGHAATGGVGEHLRAEVGGDDFAPWAFVLDFQGKVAGATGDVE